MRCEGVGAARCAPTKRDRGRVFWRVVGAGRVGRRYAGTPAGCACDMGCWVSLLAEGERSGADAGRARHAVPLRVGWIGGVHLEK